MNIFAALEQPIGMKPISTRPRKLAFENLKDRICLAFGDIVTGFAGEGFIDLNQEITTEEWVSSRAIVDTEEGYLVFGDAVLGSGVLNTVSAFDANGRLREAFDGDSINLINHPKIDDYDFRGKPIELADGSFVSMVDESAIPPGLVGLNSDGTLNQNFGVDGFAEFPTSRYSHPQLIPTPDGGFLGWQSRINSDVSEIWKFDSRGQIDSTFGLGGRVEIPRINFKVHVGEDGRILAYGTRFDFQTQEDIFVQRSFLPDGSRDNSFGNSGVVEVDNPFSPGQLIYSPNFDRFHSVFYEEGPVRRAIAIDRSGALIEEFGKGGSAEFALPHPQFYTGFGPHLGPDGSLYFQMSSRPDAQTTGVFISKLNADGTVDQQFGADGIAGFAFPGVLHMSEVDFDDAGRLLLAGYEFSPNHENVIARFTESGELDSTFGVNGIARWHHSLPSRRGGNVEIHRLAGGEVLLKSRFPQQLQVANNDGDVDGPFSLGLTGSEVEVVGLSDGSWLSIALSRDTDRVDVIRRMNNGAIDQDFGTRGRISVPVKATEDLWVSSSGGEAIFAVVARSSMSDEDAEVYGRLVVGKVDSSGWVEEFAESGLLRSEEKLEIEQVHVTPAGNVQLVFRNDNFELQVEQRKADGNVDTNFGIGGRSEPLPRSLTWLDSQPDELGRLVIATAQSDVQLHRLTPTGLRDLTFGDGFVPLPIPRDQKDEIHLAVRHGVVAVAGSNNSTAAAQVSLFAFDYDGIPIAELGNEGVRDYTFDGTVARATDIAFADDGDLLVSAWHRGGVNSNNRVLRLEGYRPSSGHNWNAPLDVNNDGFIAPNDALAIVNVLNGAEVREGWFLDTDRDGVIAPSDVLAVINYLNASGAGEGEAWRVSGQDEDAESKDVLRIQASLASLDEWLANERREAVDLKGSIISESAAF